MYESLRNSSYWEKVLLVITYDEHGGFYDHQAPPQDDVPSPDGVLASNGFGFDRLGVRVPTVLVSPWVAKGTVVHEPAGEQAPFPGSHFDHASVVASVNRIFGIGDNMTARDAWSGRFDNLVSGKFTAGAARTDCPMTVPRPTPATPERLARDMEKPLNHLTLDTLEMLCWVLLDGAAGQGVHPVCQRFQGGADAAVAALAARDVQDGRTGAAAGAEAEWQHASEYPSLFPPVARLLRQRDFPEVSRALHSAFTARVMGGEAASAA